jgi:hypothetical protein
VCSPYYRQQIDNLKSHIAEATRWLLGCEAQIRPWVFVNRLSDSDADTLVWRVDLGAVTLALGIEVQLAVVPAVVPVVIDLTEVD